jgi:histidine triad (HIT) family protein
MESCIFCKIVKGEIPSSKIHEDENFLAFLDIQPVSDGHLLVIPKRHAIWMQEADDETISGIFKLAKKLMSALKAGLICDYVSLSVGGTDVPHFHIHLMPRYHHDGLKSWPTKKYKDGEAAEIAQKIKGKII